MIDIKKELPPIGHLGYIVEDLDSEAKRFREIFGFNDFRIYDYAPLRAWSYGIELQNLKLRIAFGSLKNNQKVELIQPVSGVSPHARFLEENGPGLHHVAFYSNQYDDWLRFFREAGAEFVFEGEAEDLDVGYRRSFYAEVEGMAGIAEITEIAYKRK